MNYYWYKNAIIYSVDVETFKDSNGDGVGDFIGLTNGLTYLSRLGINCVWLLPICNTPNRDNGYDVQDYYSIDPRLGDLGHFAQFIDAATELGIKVILDLPVNHTSTEHHWFQKSRSDRKSKYRDYYIWSERKPDDDIRNIVASEGEDGSNWEYDRTAKAYYFHTFFPHQPDLNIANPDVQDEIFRIMNFWLSLGVSGFRIDAAPHMFNERTAKKLGEDPHKIFRRFREYVSEQKRGAVLIAEVDLPPERYKDFFGDEDQMHMLFNFYVNNYLFLAFARHEATPLANALQNLPELSEKEQMAIFVRNHDELNLGQLSEQERAEVHAAFAPDENMIMFGDGIRRRLAPMLGNSRSRLELAYSLLLTIPGTPVIWYGQEIGMGEDLSLEGRRSVRTVMQWANVKNGGFSDAPTNKLFRSTVTKGEFSYKKVNVDDQYKDPQSLLNWMSRAIACRRAFPEFGWGNYEIIKTGDKRILGVVTRSDKGDAYSFHNFSNEKVTFSFEAENAQNIQEIFSNEMYDRTNLHESDIILSPYGYRWFHRRKKIF